MVETSKLSPAQCLFAINRASFELREQPSRFKVRTSALLLDMNTSNFLKRPWSSKERCTILDTTILNASKPTGEHINFSVAREVKHVGSLEAGLLTRIKIENLMDRGSTPVEFDFAGVGLISSSFADEVFGKLFGELGARRLVSYAALKMSTQQYRG